MQLAAGLLVLVDEGAVLQERHAEQPVSIRDAEVRSIYQVTAHGGLLLEEASLPVLEGFKRAALRECSEELGDIIAEMIEGAQNDLRVLNDQIDGEKRIVTFGLRLPFEFAEFQALAKPKADEVSHFVLCRSTKQLTPVNEEHATMSRRAHFVMFPDEIQAVKAALTEMGQRSDKERSNGIQALIARYWDPLMDRIRMKDGIL